MAIMISIGVLFFLIGLFGIANSIFVFSPAFVQGHAINSTALRVIEGLLSAAFTVLGVMVFVVAFVIDIVDGLLGPLVHH